LKKRFDIHVLGHQVSVLSDAGNEHVANVVRYINNKADEIEKASKNIPVEKVTILVALNIADELFRLRGEKDNIFKLLENRSTELIDLIDQKRKENFPLQCA
jgi:cell division protein ZapA